MFTVIIGIPEIIPYSEKFSLVQIFTELLVSALEEISMVLMFASPIAIATLFRSLLKNLQFLFSQWQTYPEKNAKFCTMQIFPAIRY